MRRAVPGKCAGVCRGRDFVHIFAMTAEPPKDSRKDERSERLAKQLRANLARRKAQARAQRAGGADEREDGLPAASGAAEVSQAPGKRKRD